MLAWEGLPTLTPLPSLLLLQVGFEKQWLAVIQRYVVPIQAKVFPGYHSKVRALRASDSCTSCAVVCRAMP